MPPRKRKTQKQLMIQKIVQLEKVTLIIMDWPLNFQKEVNEVQLQTENRQI